MAHHHQPQPMFVAGDVDGFFGLAIDNLIQFLVIIGLCVGLLGFSAGLVVETILPAAALSIAGGNLFYAWQCRRLSAETGRRDVTALPYGINTVSLFAFVLFVMLPVKTAGIEAGLTEAEAAKVAWQLGLAACFGSGAIEFAGSFVADWVRHRTPRAALLSTLAGIAISFIAIDFAVQTFERPMVALLPLAVILTTYFGKTRLPFRIPGGAWALAMGTAAAWILYAVGEPTPVDPARISASLDSLGFFPPIPVLGDLIAGIRHEFAADYLVPVILPMGLFNVLGSLQNIESAEAAGDRYPTMPSLAVNGAGSMVAALFGSCFPTTIYIGHPGWKGIGARTGYSILNAAFFVVLALFGVTYVVNAFIPMEAGMAIVLWIGIVITAQAFQTVPREHASAVAVGLFPAIAAWGVLILSQTLHAAAHAAGDFTLPGKVVESPASFAAAGIHIEGLIALSQGFMITCVVWAAISTHTIERNFKAAAIWASVGGAAAWFGFVHAGSLTGTGPAYDIAMGSGWRWSIGYGLCAGFFAFMAWWVRRDEA